VKKGDHITFDLSGTHPQVRGPVNIRPQSVESAALMALVNFIDPTIPLNDGCLRVVDFVNPEGKLSNPRFPATVNNYYPTMLVLYSVIVKGLAKFNPKRAVGAIGFGAGSHSIGFHQSRDGKPSVQYELFVSSLGGTPEADGTPYVLGMSHITPTTPIEILETEYPVRVTRFEPIIDSGGPGRRRGGPGYRKEYQLLSDATYNLRMMGFRSKSWGVFRGKPPSVGRCTLNPGTPRERALSHLSTMELTAGDVIRAEFSGGGGCGDPLTREPALVRADVANGYVSLEKAASEFGVVLTPVTLDVDVVATERLRSQRLAAQAAS
jgi:N-methylhydantoinase B